MKKKDRAKSPFSKVGKTINFDKIVLEKLEARTAREGTSVSNLVNWICTQIVMSDEKFHAARAKYHFLKFQESKYLKEQAQIVAQNRNN